MSKSAHGASAGSRNNGRDASRNNPARLAAMVEPPASREADGAEDPGEPARHLRKLRGLSYAAMRAASNLA